jgi:hypothetical protein
MSYFRVSPQAWEPQHYAASWTPEHPAPEWWATIDAAWMIDRLQLPPERDQAAAWGWTRDRTARFLTAKIKEQAENEPRPEKREAILILRSSRARPAKNQPEGHDRRSQESANRPALNADNSHADQPRTSQEPAKNQPRTSPRARDQLPTATATATAGEAPSEPSGTAPAAPPTAKPDPASDLYAVWKSAHPASRALTADGRKAAIRILAECGGLEPAATYLSWVRESQDERARQLRGDAPWPDGSTSRRDDLESLSRHIPSRLPLAQAWDERGRSDHREPILRAAPPPGRARAGPSNRLAAAEDDRQARTRRMLAEPEIDPFQPAQLTGIAT